MYLYYLTLLIKIFTDYHSLFIYKMKLAVFLSIVTLAFSLTATCKLSQDPKSTLNITGTVVFIQDSADDITRISYAI